MTLSKQFNLLLVTIVSMIFLGTFYITIDNSRKYFMHQLENNAQDTATSLGLSLTDKLQDKVTMLTMIDAIFDRGYFETIKITSGRGETIIERRLDNISYSVPQWFVDLVRLPNVESKAKIMSGWVLAGEVMVSSYPEMAYRNLWQVTKFLFYWYVSLTLCGLLFGFIAIHYLFMPLQRVVRQAKAICNQDFVIEKHVPKTLELKHVTEAINQMVLKVKNVYSEQVSMIEKLNVDAFKDPLLDVNNRRFFIQQLSGFLSSEEDFRAGFIVMIELDGLNAYNKREGFQKGDHLLIELNKLINNALNTEEALIYARIAGGSFALIRLDSSLESLTKQTQQLLSTIETLLNECDKALHIHIGIAAYQQGMNVGQVLAVADNALQQAQANGINAYHVIQQTKAHQTKPATEWLQTIKEALSNKRLKLFAQSVLNANQNIYHREAFIKLKKEDGELLTAGSFLPMIEKLGYGIEIDCYVVGELCHFLQAGDPPIAVNISPSTLHQKQNQQSFLKTLQGIPAKFRKILQFEFSETMILKDIDNSVSFIHQVKSLGCQVGVDRVGVNFSELLYHLNKLKVNYLKIDGSYSFESSADSDKQFFMRHVSMAANTLGIEIIATNVESKQQWQCLQELKVRLGQGKYLSEVKPLQTLSDQLGPGV